MNVSGELTWAWPPSPAPWTAYVHIELSGRLACKAVGLARSTYRRLPMALRGVRAHRAADLHRDQSRNTKYGAVIYASRTLATPPLPVL